jgi:hypothetical protein
MLLILGMLLWIGSFLKYETIGLVEVESINPGFILLLSLIGNSALVTKIFAFLMVLVGSLLFNFILTKYDLVPKNILIPAMVYMVLMSYSPDLLCLHQVSISGFLIVIVLYFIFQVYTEEEAFPQVFNSGLMIGVASMFYFPSIYFLIFIWITFIIFSLYKWREWLIVLIGFLVPYIFLFTFYFWVDQLEENLSAYENYFSNLRFFDFSFTYSYLGYFIIANVIIFSLLSLFNLSTEIGEKTINIRKHYWTVFWLFFTALITYTISGFYNQAHQIFILVPVSVFISYTLSYSRKVIWTEIIFGLLVLMIFFNNLLTSFNIL